MYPILFFSRKFWSRRFKRSYLLNIINMKEIFYTWRTHSCQSISAYLVKNRSVRDTTFHSWLHFYIVSKYSSRAFPASCEACIGSVSLTSCSDLKWNPFRWFTKIFLWRVSNILIYASLTSIEHVLTLIVASIAAGSSVVYFLATLLRIQADLCVFLYNFVQNNLAFRTSFLIFSSLMATTNVLVCIFANFGIWKQ